MSLTVPNVSELQDDSSEDKKGAKKKKVKKPKNQDDNGDVDTSNFTIEERLVSAVWVHERKLDRTSIAQIKINFRIRFGKPPPTKNTLYFWEKKLFSTGKVMDAKRSGRPCRRRAHIPSVEASLQQSPGLSLRARAEQLSLPRTTLKKILREDLRIRGPEHHAPPPPPHIQPQGNHLKPEIENPLASVRQVKPPVMKQTLEPPTTMAPCAAPPKPPAYAYPEPHVSLPLSAFQHYLTYPNNGGHHQPQGLIPAHSKAGVETHNHTSPVGISTHMLHHPHQQQGHPNNHHNYIANGQGIDKSHIGYSHNNDHHNGGRNLMLQGFHS